MRSIKVIPILLFSLTIAICWSCETQEDRMHAQSMKKARDTKELNEQEYDRTAEENQKLRKNISVQCTEFMPILHADIIKSEGDIITLDQDNQFITGIAVKFEIANYTEKTIRAIRWDTEIFDIYGVRITSISNEHDTRQRGIGPGTKEIVDYEFKRENLGAYFNTLQYKGKDDLEFRYRIKNVVFSDGRSLWY